MQLETDDVRVTRWDFAPGTETGQHRHGFDYVVVPITSGTLTAETADGPSAATIELGVSYNRSAGVEHNIVNNTDAVISFVEIELLQRAG